MKKIGGNIKILYVIRKQDEFVRSYYWNQVRQNGWRMSFDQFIDELSNDYLEYDQIIRLLFSVFGKSNVIVLPFEDIVKIKSSEVTRKQFEELLSFRVVSSEITDNDSRNEMVSAVSVKLLWFLPWLRNGDYPAIQNKRLRGMFEYYYSRCVMLSRWLDGFLKLIGLYSKPSVNMPDDFMNRYSRCNKSVSRLIDKDLSGIGYF